MISDLLSVVMLTHDSHLQFKRLCKVVEAFDYAGDVEWILIDTGSRTVPVLPDVGSEHAGLQHVHKPIKPYQTAPIIYHQLEHALPRCFGEWIVFLSDKVIYHPSYLTKMTHWLRGCELVSESGCKSYVIPSGAYDYAFYGLWSPLSRTGITSTVVPHIVKILNSKPTGKSIGQQLWEDFPRAKSLHPAGPMDHALSVQIRDDEHSGWRQHTRFIVKDHDSFMCRHWLGEHYKLLEE